MLYIIDGNNLAGKLELLGQADFDNLLAEKLKNYFKNKQHKIILIFDSNEFMGNRLADGYLEIIYTPRDQFYKNADDKILEVVRKYLFDEFFKDDLIVVSDDLDLISKVEKLIFYQAKKFQVKTERSTDFSDKIKQAELRLAEKDLTDKSLKKDDIDNLNQELLKIWGKGDNIDT